MSTDTTDRTLETLLLYLIEWLEAGERTYEEVMEAWRTACPRFPVREEANDRGLVAREVVQGREVVRLTSSGEAALRKHRLMRIMTDYMKAVVL